MKPFFLTIFMIPLLLSSPKKDTYEPVVVLELFTSQGCSSCPPADVLLESVVKDKGNKNIIGLSYHVDYWNYIGWKDPFSKSTFSNKQRDYGNKFYSSSIYTPQVVINGKEHFVGSNKQKMNAKLKSYLSKPSSNSISVNDISRKEELVSFNYKVEGATDDRMLSVILVIEERITSVKRGENRNRTLKNSNIVVAEQSFDLKTSEGQGTIIIPELVNPEDKLSLVLVTKTDDLDITAGVQKRL